MPERDDFADLPALARFGAELGEAARRADMPRRRWTRTVALSLAVLLGTVATAAATAAALRGSVIRAPDARVVPADQTSDDGSTLLAAPRSADPAGGPPWALRLTRSQTGQTCTTVGQLRGAIFGIVGQDGVFRRIPPAIVDACGRGLLLGSRIVAARTPAATRSIVYGVAGAATRAATLVAGGARRALALGERGTFVAALPGYPEDTAASVELRAAGGRTTRHDVGARPGLVADVGGAPAWRLDRYALGTRQYCAHLRDARPPANRVAASSSPGGGRASTPTACIARRGRFDWAADAVRLRTGQRGRPGFDRWDYRKRPPRTLLLGVARAAGTIVGVTVTGAGAARVLVPAPNGTFALLLAASVDPRDLRLAVRLHDGTTQHGRPGHGIVADLVAARRPT